MGVPRLLALRSLVRTGWLMRGVEPGVAESVTDHSFLVAYTAMALCERLGCGWEETLRAVAMGLVHDLPEIYIGDLTPPLSTRYPWVKRELEERAVEENIGLEAARRLFREYEEGSSRAAVVVKAADYLATILQARVYMERGYDVGDIVVSLRDKLRRHLEKHGIRIGVDELIRYVEETMK